MLDFVTGLQILLIVLVAMTFFAGVWIIAYSAQRVPGVAEYTVPG